MNAHEIIAALVEDKHAGIVQHQYNECAYCYNASLIGELLHHAPSCPILAGRSWLAAHQEDSAVRTIGITRFTVTPNYEATGEDGDGR